MINRTLLSLMGHLVHLNIQAPILSKFRTGIPLRYKCLLIFNIAINYVLQKAERKLCASVMEYIQCRLKEAVIIHNNN